MENPARKGGVEGGYTEVATFLTGKPRPEGGEASLLRKLNLDFSLTCLYFARTLKRHEDVLWDLDRERRLEALRSLRAEDKTAN